MVILALVLTSCEVIKEGDRLIRVDEVEGERVHVLLEFTGFRCTNCPKAAELANNLKEQYKDHLLVVALHPASNPFTKGLYDYTCPGADSIYIQLGGTPTTSFPIGNVDMSLMDGEYLHDASEWPTMVYEAMKSTKVPDLTDANMSYWLVEDSVLGVQAMPDGTVNTQYYHRHMLRDIQANKADLVVPSNADTTHLSLLVVYTKENTILNAYETTIDFGFDH